MSSLDDEFKHSTRPWMRTEFECESVTWDVLRKTYAEVTLTTLQTATDCNVDFNLELCSNSSLNGFDDMRIWRHNRQRTIMVAGN